MKSLLTSYASLVTPKIERAQKPIKQSGHSSFLNRKLLTDDLLKE